MSHDHIIHNIKTQRMECLQCGFTQALKMPLPIEDMVNQMDFFIEAHKNCVEVADDKADAARYRWLKKYITPQLEHRDGRVQVEVYFEYDINQDGNARLNGAVEMEINVPSLDTLIDMRIEDDNT